MHPARQTAAARRRTYGAITLLTVAALTMAACGGPAGSSAGTGGAPASSSPSAGGTGGSGLSSAQAQVEQYSKLITSSTPPGPSLTGVKEKMSGKKVWYIPVFLQAPYFSAAAENLSSVLSLAGASLHVCDAGANPSQASSCIKQAINARAGAVVTDAIGNDFASAGYKDLVAAEIPVVASNNDTDKGFPESNLLTTVDNGGRTYARLAVDWITADSGGKANVLYAADRSPNGDVETAVAKDEFAKVCPECSVTYVEFSDLSVNQLPTLISAGLASHPDVDYVFGGYDAPSGIFAAQGVRQVSGRKVKFITSGGQPPALQRMVSGQQDAVAGFDPVGSMYNTADAVFRIVTGAPVIDHTPFVRLITKANLPPGAKTGDGYADGAWFTDGSYKEPYRKLWNL